MLALAKSLSASNPFYNTQGLAEAQDIVLNFMHEENWDYVLDDRFTAADIKHDSDYVDVKAFGALFADYEKIPKRNIYGVIEGSSPGPTLIFNGHLDVDGIYDPSIKTEIKEGRLWGRGSADMLSGLAALIAAANRLKDTRSEWKGKVIVTAVTDEEIGGNGTLRSLHWLKGKSLDKNAVCLIAEPSDGKVCLSSLGFCHVICEFSAASCHMGMALKKNNALWSMVKFLNEYDSPLISNFGIVQGGMDAAIPISRIRLEGTIFYPEKMSLHTLKDELQRKHPDVKMTFSPFGFAGADFPPSGFYDILATKLPSGDFPSPCDARLYKNYNIPTVIYGPGSLKDAHSREESISIDEMENYSETIYVAARKYLAY